VETGDERESMPIQTILVPTDFSRSAGAALRLAADLAGALGARIVLLHVVDLEFQWIPAGPAVVPTPVPAAVVRRIREQARATLDALAEKTPAVRRALVRTGHARDEILAAADETEADLIVMGTHGRRGVAHLFIGSVAEYVVRHARVPVMTVRRPGRGRAR
jgi:nucleotide-binding universal stress UspA family protein